MERDVFYFCFEILLHLFFFFVSFFMGKMSNYERQPAGSVGLNLGVGPPHVLVKV